VNVQEIRGDRKVTKLDKVAKPGYLPVEAVSGVKSDYAQYLESMEVPAPQPDYCDFNSVQERPINTRSKLYYTVNPENEVYSLTLRYGVGTRRMPILAYAVPLMNNAGTMAHLSPYEFKQALARLNTTINYSVSKDYMTVTLYGSESSLTAACQLLQRQILMPQLDEKQLQGIIGQEYSSRMSEKESVESQQQALMQYMLYGENSDFLTRMPLQKVVELSAGELSAAFREATNYEFTAHYVGTMPFDQVYDILSANLPLIENETVSHSPEVMDRSEYTENTIYFLPNDKAKQSNIYFFVEGEPYDIDESIIMQAFSTYFGAGFGSLVVDEIREKRAMAYSAYGAINAPQLPGKNWMFMGYVGTQADKTLEALQVYTDLLNDMPQARENFDVIKTNMRESLLSEKPGFRGRSMTFDYWKRMGYTQDPAIENMKRIEELTFDDIVKFYEENIKGKPIAIAIVGTPKDVKEKDLAKFGKVVKIQRSKLYTEDSLSF
jgi:predicted Zn-dependent peptidase